MNATILQDEEVLRDEIFDEMPDDVNEPAYSEDYIFHFDDQMSMLEVVSNKDLDPLEESVDFKEYNLVPKAGKKIMPRTPDSN
jgi:hypothetical protein